MVGDGECPIKVIDGGEVWVGFGKLLPIAITGVGCEVGFATAGMDVGVALIGAMAGPVVGSFVAGRVGCFVVAKVGADVGTVVGAFDGFINGAFV